MAQVFELLFPLLWLGLGAALWRHDRWQATLFAAFYLFCLGCEAVAMQFGEYYYDFRFLAQVCLGPPRWGAAASCVHLGGCLPLAVPCMEGIFFFAGWIWAARREANAWLRPLFGAALAVIADLAFDPVAAESFEIGTWRRWPGVGLWYWILEPGDPGDYFGIPVDNALAWLATCCGFAYAALWLPRWLKKDPRRLGFFGQAGMAALVSLAGLFAAAFAFALLDSVVTPPRSGAGYRLTLLFLGLGGTYAWATWRAWRRPSPAEGWDRRSDAVAAAVLAAALAYPLAGLALGRDEPRLLALWLLVAAALAVYGAAGRRAPRPAADQATPTLLAASSRTPFSMRRTISGSPASETEQIARRR